MTSVRVNVTAYAVTHVAAGMLRGLRRIAREAGLPMDYMDDRTRVLEEGVTTWLRSGHLRAAVLEVYDPRQPAGADLVGRFEFTVNYGYYADGDGDLWLDPDTVRFAVRKAGTYPSACRYRVIADTAPGYPQVEGWSSSTLRDTSGFTRHVTGTAVGGGPLGISLAYYTRR